MPQNSHATRLFRALSAVYANDPETLRQRLPWYFRGEIIIDPGFAHVLEDEEVELLAEWFRETSDVPYIGESSFNAVSLISDLIISNKIENVVQLGHYAGFGSLVMGLILRKISCNARIISFDIDFKMTEYCQKWRDRAGLGGIVEHVCIDSTDPLTVEYARAHLTGAPQMLFIDASKQYKNTITELALWTPRINGYVFAHDVSAWAMGDQANGALGVSDGFKAAGCFRPHELLILDPEPERALEFPYLDPCGIGIGLARPTIDFSPLDRPPARSARRILDGSKLADAENWFLGDGFSFSPGKLSKSGGGDSFVNCFAPIEPGDVLTVEMVVRNSNGKGVMVCAGGAPGGTCTFHGNGRFTGEFTAGGENSLVGIFGPAGSAFDIDHLRISIEVPQTASAS